MVSLINITKYRKIMKQLFILMILFFFTWTSQAKKNIYPFEIVVSLADVIVIGEIYEDFYSFQTSQILKGNVDKMLCIKKIDEWECDMRTVDYKKGQTLCLFLKNINDTLSIINGNTGEMLISEDSISIGEYEDYQQIKYKSQSNKLPLSEFVTGVKLFCKSFQYTGKDELFYYEKPFKIIGRQEYLKIFADQSQFTKWLLTKLANYPILIVK